MHDEPPNGDTGTTGGPVSTLANGDVRRDAKGRVLAGNRLGAATWFEAENTKRLRHGGRSERLRARQLATISDRLVADEERIAEALGGRLDALQRVFLRRFVRAVAILEPFEDVLLLETGLTSTQRARRLTPHYQAQFDRVLRAASALTSGKQAEAAPLAERLARAFAREER